MADRRCQWIALILSGIFPGLGQLYLRAWRRGGAFLLAGCAATWAWSRALGDANLLAGSLANPGTILVATLVLLVVYLWSMLDAWRAAGRA
jgi:hypothetical protein